MDFTDSSIQVIGGGKAFGARKLTESLQDPVRIVEGEAFGWALSGCNVHVARQNGRHRVAERIRRRQPKSIAKLSQRVEVCRRHAHALARTGRWHALRVTEGTGALTGTNDRLRPTGLSAFQVRSHPLFSASRARPQT